MQAHSKLKVSSVHKYHTMKTRGGKAPPILKLDITSQ